MTSGGARRALFATSNGFGLGHVTRAMAIARRLPSHLEPVIFTLSEALPIVRRQGFLAEYFSSRNPGDETSAQWNLRLARRVDSLLDDYQPSVVVFDGTYPYSGMLESLRGAGVPLVWCRRGMWKAGSGRANLMFESEFELVIEPGELAASDDAGATVRGGRRVRRVPPILLCDDADLLDRDEASRRAGLDGRRLNVLMQPGWENEAFGPSAGMCLERLARVPEAQVVVAVSPLRSRAVPLPDEVTKVATYPLASIYRAFDFSISGAGYNIFHEAVAYAVPAMFVPNAGTPLDDQVARARYAERHGLARNWEDRAAATLDGHLSVLLDPGARTEMARLARASGMRNGAADAARLVAELAAGGGP